MLVELLLTIAITLIVYRLLNALGKKAKLEDEYFQQRGIKCLKQSFGAAVAFFLKKSTAAEFSSKMYNEFPDEPIYGRFDFGKPVYILRDPKIVKHIAVKEFDHFVDHQGFIDEHTDKLWGNSLFFLTGSKWRDMRATLSPAFTGSKMRQMFELVSECAEDYVNHFLAEAKNGKKIDIEMKETFSRYTNDVIASCAFGLRVNSLADPNNDFLMNGRKVADFSGLLSIIKIITLRQMPKVSRALKLRFLDAKVSDMFKSIILDTMETRKKNSIYRPDMINLLMQVREGSLKQQSDEKVNETSDGFATVEESEVGKGSVNRIWNDDEVVAQCFLFFVAGFETSSTMLMLASYELVANQDVQQKLYEEIAETNERIGGKRITYDVLQKMQYLDQVVCEVLRKWPPALQTDRKCIKDCVYDDGDKLRFTIEKGSQLFIPIYGFHHCPKYFNDPERFDPDRFSEQNKSNIPQGAYIPFGVGPRNCIGSRFALMELKAILYYLLLNFSFEANEKTEIPIKLEKTPFNLHAQNGVNIQLKPRQK